MQPDSTAPNGNGCRSFSVVFIIGAPGAGKGTICTHLAEEYNLVHYSVGDGLRAWMRENRATELATEIRNKLDNQGFLTSKELNPFIYRAILHAHNLGARGILIDGYPRCTEQMESVRSWPFQDIVPLAPNSHGVLKLDVNPDVVLSFEITKENAKARYLNRARDNNDSAAKFERRFAEYQLETIPVAEVHQQKGILISVRSTMPVLLSCSSV
ncbi:hypothetical protein FSHL1_000141 [Fusarium sambucinum]